LARGEEVLDPKKVDEVVALIQAIPQWPLTPLVADDDDRRAVARNAAKVQDHCGRIGAYDLQVIRAAMARILDNKPTQRNREAMYFVCLYLFQVPADINDVPRKKRFYVQGGYSPLPESARTSALWPWRMVEGKLEFDTSANGVESFARPYPVIEAFDYLHETFGRRKRLE